MEIKKNPQNQTINRACVCVQKQASKAQQQHKPAQHPFQKPSPLDLVSTGAFLA